MPTYDYVCAACEHAFEHFQSMTSRRLRKCPACGKPKLERLIGSGAGVIFKGSGFYETDYKRKGGSGASEKSSSEKSSSSKSDGDAPKSDAKNSKASEGPSSTSSATKKGDG